MESWHKSSTPITPARKCAGDTWGILLPWPSPPPQPPETLENRKPRSLGRKAGNHSPWADLQLVYIVLSIRKQSEEATKTHKQACKDAPCSQTSTGSPKPRQGPQLHSAGLQARTPPLLGLRQGPHLCWVSGKDPIISSCVVQSICSYLLRISNDNQEPCLLPNIQWHAGPSLLLPVPESLTLQQDSNSRWSLESKTSFQNVLLGPQVSTLTYPSVLLARADSTSPSNSVLSSTGCL